jgi:hypothetical protein
MLASQEGLCCMVLVIYNVASCYLGCLTDSILLLWVQTGPRAYPASCTVGTASFPVVKLSGRDVNDPRLTPRLKKE